MYFLKYVILKSSGKAERTSQVAPGVEIQSANAEDVKDTGSVLGGEDLLGKDVAIHSSILAWSIPWTEEPGGLQPIRVAKSQTRLKRLATTWAL